MTHRNRTHDKTLLPLSRHILSPALGLILVVSSFAIAGPASQQLTGRGLGGVGRKGIGNGTVSVRPSTNPATKVLGPSASIPPRLSRSALVRSLISTASSPVQRDSNWLGYRGNDTIYPTTTGAISGSPDRYYELPNLPNATSWFSGANDSYVLPGYPYPGFDYHDNNSLLVRVASTSYNGVDKKNICRHEDGELLCILWFSAAATAQQFHNTSYLYGLGPGSGYTVAPNDLQVNVTGENLVGNNPLQFYYHDNRAVNTTSSMTNSSGTCNQCGAYTSLAIALDILSLLAGPEVGIVFTVGAVVADVLSFTGSPNQIISDSPCASEGSTFLCQNVGVDGGSTGYCSTNCPTATNNTFGQATSIEYSLDTNNFANQSFGSIGFSAVDNLGVSFGTNCSCGFSPSRLLATPSLVYVVAPAVLLGGNVYLFPGGPALQGALVSLNQYYNDSSEVQTLVENSSQTGGWHVFAAPNSAAYYSGSTLGASWSNPLGTSNGTYGTDGTIDPAVLQQGTHNTSLEVDLDGGQLQGYTLGWTSTSSHLSHAKVTLCNVRGCISTYSNKTGWYQLDYPVPGTTTNPYSITLCYNNTNGQCIATTWTNVTLPVGQYYNLDLQQGGSEYSGYAVNVTEKGLPQGTEWGGQLGTSYGFSTTDSYVTYELPNGSYSVTAWTAARYVPSAGQYNFTINGRSVQVVIDFIEEFNITFGTTSLPSPPYWSVEINGQMYDSNGSDFIHAWLLNGSYQYLVPPVEMEGQLGRFVASGGTLRVAGSPSDIGVPFIHQYLIDFNEINLPPGTRWSVVDESNGTRVASSSPTIGFWEVNTSSGQYDSFSIPGVGSWTPQQSSYSVSVEGTNVSIEVRFGTSLTFEEVGLPNGTSWGVWLNGTNEITTGVALNFTEPNGTYSYSIPPPRQNWIPSPRSGNVTIAGISQVVSITFIYGYNISFVETGLPSGDSWSVYLEGYSHSSTAGTPIVFLEGNGSYSYVISAVESWTAPGGTVSVEGHSASVETTFVYAYSLAVSETGLPSGSFWIASIVNLSGRTVATSVTDGPSFQLNLPNGTYWDQVGTPEQGYLADPSCSSVVIAGRSAAESISFYASSSSGYHLTIGERGLPYGGSYSVSVSCGPTQMGNVNATYAGGGTGGTNFTLPDGTYGFKVSVPASEQGTYSPSPNSGTVSISGAQVLRTITFSSGVPVTFMQSIYNHLPAGSQWGVTLGSKELQGSGSYIAFLANNGTTPFTIDLPSGEATKYKPDPATGDVATSGEAVVVTVNFLAQFSVNFTESGLPSGQTWRAILGGTTRQSNSNEISFLVPEGSYSYLVPSVGAYLPSNACGTLSVFGDTSVTIEFTTYSTSVTFTSSGLPANHTWYVSLGCSLSIVTSGNSITFQRVVNGSYAYVVGVGMPACGSACAVPTYLSVLNLSLYESNSTPSPKFLPSPSRGVVSVAGEPVDALIRFVEEFPVVFHEAGLSPGSEWTVELGGGSNQTTGSQIDFFEVNGSYPFLVTPPSGDQANPHCGTVPVSGDPVAMQIAFSAGSEGSCPADQVFPIHAPSPPRSVGEPRAWYQPQFSWVVVGIALALALFSVRPRILRRGFLRLRRREEIR